MRYLKQFSYSIVFMVLVVYLSFFRPPSVPELGRIPHLDKLVHFGMYFVMSALLWWNARRGYRLPKRAAYVVALIFPILFSGAVELLQAYATDYRGGDWLDFLANSLGALAGTLFYRCLVHPRLYNGRAW